MNSADALSADSYRRFSLRRVATMVMRHVYLFRRSWPRLLDLTYWPIVQMVTWGFLTMFLVEKSSFFAQAFGVLLSSVLLWDVLFRGQIGLFYSFLEEVWSRNLGHLFVTPLRPVELAVSLMAVSLLRTTIGLIPASFLAMAFFDFSIYSLGLPLIGFYANLMIMGWAVGLVMAGLIMRYGLGAENLAWGTAFILMPITAIYYPISVLPEWLQPISRALPASHVFEGVRSILVEGVYRADLMAMAAVLNVFYVLAGGAAFLWFFHAARRRGLLLNLGE